MPTTQLPLPLVFTLPYMGDDTGCHIWEFDAPLPETYDAEPPYEVVV